MSAIGGILAGGALLAGTALLAKKSGCNSCEVAGMLADAMDDEQDLFFGVGQLQAPRRKKGRSKKRKSKSRKKRSSRSSAGIVKSGPRKGKLRKGCRFKKGGGTVCKSTGRKKTTRRKKARRRSLSGLGSCSVMRTPSGPRCYCNKRFAKMSACR
jgi:hypothetical protein